MRHSRISKKWAAVLSLGLLPGLGAAAQEPESPEEPPPEVVVEHATVVVERATVVEPSEDTAKDTPAQPLPLPRPQADADAAAPPGHHAVDAIRLVKAGAGRVDAARQEDWIAFDKIGDDERYDVYVMRLEVGVETCLTCEIWDLRKESMLNPVWHPSGEYLVVQVQGSPKRRQLNPVLLSTPYRGMGSELWAITRDGRDYWQLTRLGERGSAVLDPHFSHEGDLLVWSERLTNVEEPWGEWGLRVTEFKVKRRLPRLGESRVYRSGIGHGLVVAHDFTADDRGLLVAAIPAGELGERADLVRVDLETEKTQRITHSPDEAEGLVSPVPYSDYLVWTTDRGLTGLAGSGRLRRRSELWIRSESGALQERLTYFNHPASDHFLGDALIDDLAWTADGESVLLHVLSAREGEETASEGIYLVKLGPDYRR